MHADCLQNNFASFKEYLEKDSSAPDTTRPVFVWGVPSADDKLLHRETIKGGLCSAWETVRFHYAIPTLSPATAVSSVIGVSTTRVRRTRAPITGRVFSGPGVRVKMLDGGPGSKFATLEIVPSWFRSFEVTLLVFGSVRFEEEQERNGEALQWQAADAFSDPLSYSHRYNTSPLFLFFFFFSFLNIKFMLVAYYPDKSRKDYKQTEKKKEEEKLANTKK